MFVRDFKVGSYYKDSESFMVIKIISIISTSYGYSVTRKILVGNGIINTHKVGLNDTFNYYFKKTGFREISEEEAMLYVLGSKS